MCAMGDGLRSLWKRRGKATGPYRACAPHFYPNHYEHYAEKFRTMGGIVESWIDGPDKCPSSVQLRVTPLSSLN